MSGKRQHFIPQFLQRGFASRVNGDDVYAWVFRKGASPFNSNIENIGAEGYFYAERDDTEADDLITDAEGPLGALVRTLRAMSPSQHVADPAVAEMIAHLEVRTRHLRHGFLQLSEYLASRLLDVVSDQRTFLKLVERKLENDPSSLRESFADELAKRRLPQELLDPVLALSRSLLPVVIERLRPQLPIIADALRPVVANVLKEAVKSGQINALKREIAPAAKAERYKGLTYAVIDIADANLILGDAMLLFHVDSPRRYKTILEKHETLRAIYLPLSSTRLLVGTSEQDWSPPVDLREAIARCSLELFIAHEDCDANRRLAGCIGENAALLTTTELEEIIASSMDGYSRP